MELKRKIFNILEIGHNSDTLSRAFDYALTVVVTVNILVLILRTFDGLRPYAGIMDVLEDITLVFFVVEYALRIWTSCYLFPGRSALGAAVGFIFSLDGIVELLTILPMFYLSGFVAFRMMRVIRIFHLFRINMNYDSFTVIRSVLIEKRNQLAFSMFIILVLMLASSLFMYSAEHSAQPEVFKNAFSGIWWSVSTLLTVGYGDIYPITICGKFMAIIIAFLGVGAVAIPTGIISAGFVEHFTMAQRSDGSEDLPLGLQLIVLGMDSAWIGLSAGQLKEGQGVTIALVRHMGQTFVPDGEYLLQLGDELAVYIERTTV